MKKLTLIGLLIGALAVGLIIGGYVGVRLASRAFGTLAYSKPEIDLAANAAEEAEWLAELRLGETNTAISEMENTMNIQVETLAEWDSVGLASDEKTRQARDRWLVPVKVYRESYPVGGSDMVRANELLSTIPGRNPKSTCKSGVCRLDDRRLATLNTNTNSPWALTRCWSRLRLPAFALDFRLADVAPASVAGPRRRPSGGPALLCQAASHHHKNYDHKTR